jgi:hypothetical protein
VLTGSHKGNELTIAVDIARYTAVDAIVEGLALNLGRMRAAIRAGGCPSG